MESIVYGKKAGKLIHISEVENGLACDCICPECSAKFVAKNNPLNITIPHFAHYNETECKGGLESWIHSLAKDVIFSRKRVLVPDFEKKAIIIKGSSKVASSRPVFIKGGTYTLDNVFIEKNFAGYRPDIIAKIQRRSLAIEIKVSHAIGRLKREFYIDNSIPVFEIDLSNLAPESVAETKWFEFEVLDNPENRYWIHNPKGEAKLQFRKQYLLKGNSHKY